MPVTCSGVHADLSATADHCGIGPPPPHEPPHDSPPPQLPPEQPHDDFAGAATATAGACGETTGSGAFAVTSADR